MNRWSLTSPILLISLALAAEVVVLMSVTSPLRAVLGLWFVLVAPGWAALRLLDLPMRGLASAATAVGISVSIDILVSLALFYLRWWSIQLAMTILLALIVVLVVADLPVVRHMFRRRALTSRVPETVQP
ncbi:MAG: DUF1616 domain-containing protein [Chloroflexota bacterium]|nr:DUF1616 domain-containing protein [Chloroflexota bacterium]